MYNRDVNARPQFSLSTLLLATGVVCFAAAIAAPIRPPPRPGGWGWEDLGFAIHAQAPMRLAGCVVFPAMFAAGALAGRGHARAFRAFCAGGSLAALVPVLHECNRGIHDSHDAPVIVWALVPCLGLLCAAFYWVFTRGKANA